MAISMRKARDYVFTNGALWERALYSYLFDDGPLNRLHQCLLCYKNPDGGWGHGLEHDLKTPDSNPLALEYLLAVIREFNLPIGNLFDDTASWLEKQRKDDGSLKNPASIHDYPIAPWWTEWGGQTAPDSIVGNLTKLELVTPSLAESTQKWVRANQTLEKIAANEWLFMAYHAFDYFMNVDDFPNVAAYRAATTRNIVELAQKLPEKQYHSLFKFASDPKSDIAKALPDEVIQQALDHLAATQREDGGWADQHDLPQWQPMTTISALYALKNYERL